MHLRLWSLAAPCMLTLAQAQSSGASSSGIVAPSAVANILQPLGIVPNNLVDAAATFIASDADNVHDVLNKTLSQPGVDPEKLTNPELYYSYGHSPPVYPSRKCAVNSHRNVVLY